MVQINFAQKQINAKIVYYGPGMSGKTTNLEVVHKRAPESNRGDLTSISTDGDRTLFFDYMPLDLGTIAGMRTSFQMYTVPGQVYYNSTRKLVLQGVDGVIFVADSSPGAMEANLESLRNLEENLNEYGKSLASMPHVVQFNKRDLPGALSVEELSKALNLHNAPVFEAVAATGQGVFPTLKGLASLVLKHIQTECSSGPRPSMAQTGFHPAPRVAPAAPANAAGEPAPVRASEPAPARPSGGLELAPRNEPARAPAPAAAAASLGTTNMTPRSAVPSAALPSSAPAPAPSAAPVATAAPTPAGTSAAQLMRQQSAARPKAQAAAAPAPVAAPVPVPVAAPRSGARRAPRAGAAPAESSWKSNLFVVAAAAVGAGVAAAILKFI
jgi:hypothetical protein